MRCSSCGTENEERFAYCTKCGDPLADERRFQERYGARDPAFPDPLPPDEVIPDEPYLVNYDGYGDPHHQTKRGYWLYAAAFFTLGLTVTLINPSLGAIVLGLAVGGIPMIWVIGRHNAARFRTRKGRPAHGAPISGCRPTRGL
jgi:hypothetical protein